LPVGVADAHNSGQAAAESRRLELLKGLLMRGRLSVCAIPALIAVAAGAAPAGPPPIEAFARMPNIENISISPTGRSLAWLAPVGDKHRLIVLDRLVAGSARPVLTAEGNDFDLDWCAWANDTRLLCGVTTIVVQADFTYPMTRLIGINADGTKMKVLMRGGRAGESLMQDRIIDWTPDEPNSVLIAGHDLLNAADEGSTGAALGQISAVYPSVFELNIYDGRLRERVPDHPPITRFITDAHGNVRLGGGLDGTRIFYYARLAGDSAWRRLERFEVFDRDDKSLKPIAMGSKPDTMYALGLSDGRNALWEVDLTDREGPRLVFSHPQVDVGNALFAADHRMIGVFYETDRQFIHYTDPHAQEVMRALNEALPGKFNVIADASADEQTYAIASASDVDAASYWVFDRAARSLKSVGKSYPELDQSQLGQMRSIAFPARDGTSIPGYLTAPPGVRAEHLPLIVMPHGGPISRDSWRFNFLLQFLVSRGYAVLQMNFRGSRGYGNDWYWAAHQDWGGLTYDDITDGARWAVKQGIADPKRMCIVGWSFGGYAALLGAVRNGDLYRCSVSIAGVSDLLELESDEYRYGVGAVARRQIGGNREKLRADSPRRHAATASMPILIVHGDHDFQASVEQSRLMVQALKDARKPYEFILLKGASHQLDRQSDRITLLTAVEKFLAKNLDQAPPSSP
jgi:acetyl esterase/lipase